MTCDLEKIKNMIAKFSDEKFGKDRPYTAPLHHLHEEVDEAIDSGDLYEFVDILLLTLDAYRKAFPDLTTDNLLLACYDKITNDLCTREWHEPDEHGVFKHIKK